MSSKPSWLTTTTSFFINLTKTFLKKKRTQTETPKKDTPSHLPVLIFYGDLHRKDTSTIKSKKGGKHIETFFIRIFWNTLVGTFLIFCSRIKDNRLYNLAPPNPLHDAVQITTRIQRVSNPNTNQGTGTKAESLHNDSLSKGNRILVYVLRLITESFVRN